MHLNQMPAQPKKTSKFLPSKITINADSFAVLPNMPLAKYVEGKIGVNPWLPIVNQEADGQIRPRPLIYNDGGNGWAVSGNYEPIFQARSPSSR